MALAETALQPMLVSPGLAEAINDQQPVSGFTHNFYRYPARFAPSFARQVILSFTKPGDLVYDAFLGGGTSVVEAVALGRDAIGTDISSLAIFLSQTKSTPLSDRQLQRVEDWGERLVPKLNLHSVTSRSQKWLTYQRNISDRRTWRVRKLFEMSLRRLTDLTTVEERRFARCILLRTGQWALDCRDVVPTAEQIRQTFQTFLEEMLHGARELAMATKAHPDASAICLHRSAVGIEDDPIFRIVGPPRLVLTSPPYPGVHVLYHRWQVLGRKETPAPFWIAGTLDGAGSSFYTFGDRKQKDLRDYYVQARRAFSSISRISDAKTTVVQMVAFGDASWQLPAYLEMMEASGFEEILYPELANAADGRSWRVVPNRKWYADAKGAISSSKEVVLFHKKRTSY